VGEERNRQQPYPLCGRHGGIRLLALSWIPVSLGPCVPVLEVDEPRLHKSNQPRKLRKFRILTNTHVYHQHNIMASNERLLQIAASKLRFQTQSGSQPARNQKARNTHMQTQISTQHCFKRTPLPNRSRIWQSRLLYPIRQPTPHKSETRKLSLSHTHTHTHNYTGRFSTNERIFQRGKFILLTPSGNQPSKNQKPGKTHMQTRIFTQHCFE
jgi:hypothetical protein